MKTLKTLGITFCIALTGPLFLGCSSLAPEAGTDSSIQANPATVPVARVTRPVRSESLVAARLSLLVDVFADGAVPSVTSPARLASTPELRLHRTAIALPARTPQTRYDVDIGDDDKLKGRYESRDDSFEVFDRTISPATPAAAELTKTEATRLFAATLDRLVAAGLIDPTRVRPQDLIIRQIHASEGDQNGLRRAWVDEHAFFVPLSIAGIRVGTTQGLYGLHINIHRSGQLRRIAFSGAAMAANEPGTVAVEQYVPRAQRPIPATTLVHAAVGKAEVRPLGLRYLVNEDATASQDLVARDLLWVSPTRIGPEGQVIQSKAYTVSYAVNDVSNEIEFSPPLGALGPSAGDRIFTK